MTEKERLYELISARLDGELDSDGEAELAGLLASDPEYWDIFTAMSGAREALSERAEPPAELLSGVMAGVRKLGAQKRARRRRYIGVTASLAAAAVLAVAFVPKMLHRPEAGPGDSTGAAPYGLEPRDVSGPDDSPAVCIGPEGGTPVAQGPTDPATEPTTEPTDPPTEPTTEPTAAPTEPATEPPTEPTGELPEPEDGDLVNVSDYIPDIYVDLKYATDDNFTGQVIYDFTEARLRYGTVKKLMEVQAELREMGLSLKIWDACRPTSAQFKLWEICPDSRYVANPNHSGSTHSRGNTVDITLVTLDGEDIEMPTGFDDFTSRADRDYSDVAETAAANAELLEKLMTSHGFKPYTAEWWHYTDTVSYPVVED